MLRPVPRRLGPLPRPGYWATLCLLAPLLASCPSAPTDAEPEAQPQTLDAVAPPLDADPAVLLSDVAVIGASASAGFGLEARPLTEHPDLGHYLSAAIRVPDAELTNHSSDLFFLSPVESAERQLSAGEGELWVALDFLFWFAYGPHTDAERVELFERGLELLELIEEPLLVGDLPHMVDADQSMLAPLWIPKRATLEQLNRRLLAWAAESPTRLVVPLAEWAERQREPGLDLALRDLSWSAEDKGRLLQADGLHPSREGTAALALLALDRIEHHLGSPGALEPWVQWSLPSQD
ncbi:MAG: hypothetical protein ACYS26_05565 [Planctomycetota bacterium]